MNKFYSLFFFKSILGRISVSWCWLIIFSFAFTPAHLLAQDLEFSYSYLNITRNNGGGTLEKGDIIEVHALVKVNVTASRFYYIDTIRAGTEYISNSLRIVTNENLTFLGPYTDANSDDRGVYTTSGGIPRLRVNLGSSASNPTATNFGSTSGGGTVVPNDRPKFYGTTLFVVSYQLKVTADFGDIIYLTGNYYYQTNGTRKNHRFNYAGIRIVENIALCNNFSSASFTADSSFGAGSIQNRALPAAVPGYTKINLGPNSPQDNYYSIANNTSANGTTNDDGPYSSNPARVFNFWDIIGDHTGAADPVAGNPPTPKGSYGGYMLVVNSAYPTGEAYRDTIRNVCPNTYYEFSAWFRNICGTCGLDADSRLTREPGVKPNISYTINDIDYYTTGDIPYTRTWVKRGFIYKTGPSETEFRITVKNNAAGGGGNDWVLDDIKLATCYPNLIMNPNDTAKVCAGSRIYLSDTVKSYFNNYVNFCWEKSTDGGNTWNGTGVCGTKTPVLQNGLWVYVVDTVFSTAAADSGNFYRLKVATTFANLSDSKCAVNNSQQVFLKVYNIDCKVLESQTLQFSGKMLRPGTAELSWRIEDIPGARSFEIERSGDGSRFVKIGTVPAAEINKGSYSFIDDNVVSARVFYRLKVLSGENGRSGYSETIALNNNKALFKLSAVNPIRNDVQSTLSLPQAGEVEMQLCDVFGKVIRRQNWTLPAGSTSVTFENTSHLAAGMYIIRARYGNSIEQKKIYKF